MKNFLSRTVVTAIATITLAISPTNLIHAGNLAVSNGSFENFSGGHGTSNDPSQLANPQHSGTGYTTLADWTVNNNTYGFLMAPGVADKTGSFSPEYNNSFSLWGSNNSGLDTIPNSSPHGGNYLALDGGSSYRGGGISQTITGLTAGTWYNVSFDWAGAQQHSFTGNTTEQVQVSLGSQFQRTAILDNVSHGFTGWQQVTFGFKADGPSEVLNFLAIGTPNGVPPIVLLDGVSFDAAPVPEPGTLALSALGVLGLVAVRARRRAKRDVV